MSDKVQTLFLRKKRHADRTVRCYLTLDCTSNCEFCSAGIPSLTVERKAVRVPAEVWAEGINRRRRDTILAGGEPLLYDELPRLINLIDGVRLSVFTNLQCDITQFLEEVTRPISFLVSLHPSTPDLDEWSDRVDALIAARHSVRFHIVKSGDNWLSLRNFLVEEKGYTRVTCCGDQRGGVKSRGIDMNKECPSVRCAGRIFLFGPDGYRYICVKLMGLGGEFGRFEHMSEPDGPNWQVVDGCSHFGLCTGCDNNIEGTVEYLHK